MFAKAYCHTVFLMLCLSVLCLQSGCGVSEKADTPGGASSGTSDIRLSLTTPSGFNTVVADGRSTIPLHMLVTNAAGTGMPNVPVTFATTAGSLSEAPVVRATRELDGAGEAAATRAAGDNSLTVTTNTNGVAQVLLTAGTMAEIVLVTADVQGFRTNISIAFTAGTAARVQVAAVPTNVSGGATSVITATVTDANGNLVTGTTVTFALSTNTSGATLTPTTQVTDSNGQAAVMYTAGFIAGADTVRAQVTSAVAGTTSITVAPTPAGTVTTVTVAPGAPSVVADGASSVVIRATVTGTAGPVPGVPVTFTTTAGRLSAPTARTDKDGIAVVSLIAATSLGKATVAATAEGVSSTTTVDFVAGAPTTLTLNASPPVVNARATSIVQATVTDANANPVAQSTLVFSLTTNASGATLSPLVGTTDTNGQFTVTYTAGASLGTDIVQARATTGITGITPITVAVQQSGGVATVAVTSGASSIVANGTDSTTLRATVKDTTGAAVAGTAVTFTTTAGRLSSTTATTDSTGVATVTLTASTTIGTATVTATAGGVRSTATVTLVAGAPAAVTLRATPSRVNVGATSIIRATVADANGNPTPTQTLTLSLTTNVSGASLSALTGVTDANGLFTVTYTAGTTLGADVVRAQTTNGTAGTVTVTVAAQATNVASVTVVAGTQTLVANGTSSVAIRATVRDAAGVNLSGVDVTFTTTAGTLSATTVPTDSTGVATVNLTAPTNLGAATVTADADGFSNSVTVTFIAGPPATVALQASTTNVNIGSTATIQVTVTDANGNPTGTQALTMALATNTSGATLTPLTGTTDANGQVLLTYTAGQTAGTDTISARTVNGVTGTVSITVALAAGASQITLLVSSPQLASNGLGSVTLTALARNATNNVVSGAAVNFTTNSGSIQVVRGITDATGTAIALLTTGGDPRNRTITVTATIGTISSTNTVQVSGTTLTVSGASTLVLGATTRLSILLRDSGGVGITNQPITVSSALGNTLSATTVTTDTTGQATVDVTGVVPGTETITVSSALGPTATASLSISADHFVFTTPAPPPAAPAQVPLNTPQTITVHWDKAGTPQINEIINFFATRGNFAAAPPCPAPGLTVPTISPTTDGQGNATAIICADNAGPAVISAAANVSSGPSNQITIEFIATTVASLVLQTTRTTLGVNPPGTSTQQSVITAVLRDAQGNLVKNQTVSFSLTDITGGQIFPASAITDSFGRASTVYTAGAVPSAQGGVLIKAAVGAVTDMVALTVAQQALFVILGTGNLINVPTSTQYSQPYSVLVTDANGNPVTNAIVELNVLPTQYEKGFYAPFVNSNGSCTGWDKVRTSPPCQNEDTNFNGILDAGEDFNSNGRVDPGNVAAAPNVVTTNASGFGFFDVVYAREFTWVEIELEARTVVAGSEATSRARFFLRGVVTDFNNCTIAPPGQKSPYGLATTCNCDERVDPACPSVVPQAVTLTAAAGLILPHAGGTFGFSVSGGSQTSYTVTTTAGALSTQTVFFSNPTFTLTVPANPSTTTSFLITLTARDSVTGQTDTITLTQLP